MLKKLFFLAGFALLIFTLANLFPTPAAAQCGTGPVGSCVECHLAQAPVDEKDLWHGVHARKNCCTNCHGGNCSAAEKEVAHVGIVPNPLEDIYTNCHACHPADYWQRAEVFAAELKVTPASRATPSPGPTPDPLNRQPQIEILPPPRASNPQVLALVSAALTAILVFLGFSLLIHRARLP